MKAETPVPAPGLRATDVEVLDICVRISQFLGLPKSVGELYGILFLSPRPLALDDVVERLQMSKGSASQGLKQLRAYGAIQQVYVPGDRRDCYQAEADLGKLVSGFLRERVEPGVRDLGQRLERIRGHASELPAAERTLFQKRIDKLQNWQRKAQKYLPYVSRFLVR